jgi:hypothetical protein
MSATEVALDWETIESEAVWFRSFGWCEWRVAERLGVGWNTWEKHFGPVSSPRDVR